MNLEKIGKYIQEKRKKAGMTQAELGEKLGIGSKAVSKWECGVALPDVSLFDDICKIFNISLSELLAGQDKNESKKILFGSSLIILILIFLISIILNVHFMSMNKKQISSYLIKSGRTDYEVDGLMACNRDKCYMSISRIRKKVNFKGNLILKVSLVDGKNVVLYKKDFGDSEEECVNNEKNGQCSSSFTAIFDWRSVSDLKLELKLANVDENRILDENLDLIFEKIS